MKGLEYEIRELNKQFRELRKSYSKPVVFAGKIVDEPEVPTTENALRRSKEKVIEGHMKKMMKEKWDESSKTIL
ncbi:9182_t:CDS:1, partial [Acaulospora morrowiae]